MVHKTATRVQASGTNSGIRITISDSSNNAYAYSVFVKGISGKLLMLGLKQDLI